jgi:hypothetical protein
MILLSLLAAAAFDLAPSRVSARQLERCRIDETLPLGTGTLQKLTCRGPLDWDTLGKRCDEGARRNSLPPGITAENCRDEYARGHFLFRGETKELVVARRKDGMPVLVFRVLDGDTLTMLQHFGSAALIGVRSGTGFHYAVVTTRGVLKAPYLGNPEDIHEVTVVGGRVRVWRRGRGSYTDLVPGGEGQLVRK